MKIRKTKNQSLSYSQNLKIRKMFVTLGLNILRFYRPKMFLKQISVKFDVIYYKSNKKPYFLCLIGSKIHVKVSKILRICRKKFCEYPP